MYCYDVAVLTGTLPSLKIPPLGSEQLQLPMINVPTLHYHGVLVLWSSFVGNVHGGNLLSMS